MAIDAKRVALAIYDYVETITSQAAYREITRVFDVTHSLCFAVKSGLCEVTEKGAEWIQEMVSALNNGWESGTGERKVVVPAHPQGLPTE